LELTKIFSIWNKKKCEVKRLVILSGAGISAESGIRTFRDMNGLWEEYDVMEVASIEAWNKNPDLIYVLKDPEMKMGDRCEKGSQLRSQAGVQSENKYARKYF
jgi:NAD-dependent deacetylase